MPALHKFPGTIIQPKNAQAKFSRVHDAGGFEEGNATISRIVVFTSAQVKALNASPQVVVNAPGTEKANILIGAVLHKPAGTAYVAAGNLSIRYTNLAGLEISACPATGFLTAATAQTRYMNGFATASNFDPTVNSPLVLTMTTSEATTGTSVLAVKFFYRVIRTIVP